MLYRGLSETTPTTQTRQAHLAAWVMKSTLLLPQDFGNSPVSGIRRTLTSTRNLSGLQ